MTAAIENFRKALGITNAGNVVDEIRKSAASGELTRAQLYELLTLRAAGFARDGETQAIVFEKAFSGIAPRDPIGAQLFLTLRKMETAFAGRQDDDPIGRELLSKMLEGDGVRKSTIADGPHAGPNTSGKPNAGEAHAQLERMAAEHKKANPTLKWSDAQHFAHVSATLQGRALFDQAKSNQMAAG